MPLTTQDGTKLGQTVVQDLEPNTNVEVEAPKRQISPDAAILFNQAIIARPLMVPEVCSIHVKNSEYRYRWVNRDGLGGRVYTERRHQGFLNATTDDVEVLSGDAQAKDGEIRAGDVILMKIRQDLYDGAMKYNMQKAYARVRKELNPPRSTSDKIAGFVPKPDAVEAALASSDPDEVRESMEDFRTRRQAESDEKEL